MSDTVLTAARTRLTAALPGWHDASGDPHPTPVDALPAYACALSYTSAERVGMGDARLVREGQLEIGIHIAATAASASPAAIHAEAQTIEAALLAPPADLGGAAWQIIPEGFEAEHAGGDTRISRGTLIFTIQTLAPGT